MAFASNRLISLSVIVAISTAAPVTLVAEAPPAAAVASSYSFSNAGFDGGGFIGALGRNRLGTLVAGGDTQGFFRSVDSGAHWSSQNSGLENLAERQVASVLASPADLSDPAADSTWYAGVGNARTGGLYVSRNDGVTWQLASTGALRPVFSGGNEPGNNGHPRATGRLLAVDIAGGYLFAGTYDQGLLRAPLTNLAQGWEVIAAPAATGSTIRSISFDADTATIYMAENGLTGGSVRRVTSVRAAKASVQVGAVEGPSGVEELLYLKGSDTLYAAGSNGVHRRSGGAWAAVTGGDGDWYTISGYHSSAGDILYVGAETPLEYGTTRYYHSIKKYDGSAWVDLTTPPGQGTTYDYTVVGTADPWWMSLPDPRGAFNNMLAGALYKASFIAVDPDAAGNDLYVAGRSGVWRSLDDGATWSPAVNGFNVSYSQVVVPDPQNLERVGLVDTDWQFIGSNDGFRHVARDTFVGQFGTADQAFDLSWDTGPATSVAYLGIGDQKGNIAGDVVMNPAATGTGTDGTGSAAWTSTRLRTAAGGKRPMGVAVNRIGGELVVLAALEDGGVWRYAKNSAGNPTWTPASTPAGLMSGPYGAMRAPFSWLPGSPYVYLFDRDAGVYRSSDAGATWAQIWALNSAGDDTGFVVTDPAHPAVLWVSVVDQGRNIQGVFKLSNAQTGASVGNGIGKDPWLLPAGTGSPGPMAVSAQGYVYVASQQQAGAPAKLLRSSSALAGPAWQDVADAQYRATTGLPRSMAIGTSERLYVVMAANSVMVGEPAA